MKYNERNVLLKAVIFDMDGVIVDSEPLHVKAERETLAPYGIKLEESELQKYMGRTPKVLLEDVIKKHHLNTTIEKIYPVHMKNLLNLYKNEVELIPGVLELITELNSEGVGLAVASSSDKILILSVLEKFHLSNFFKVVVSGEEVKNVKPSPDIFLKTAEKLGYSPGECVVIEDSSAGVRSARSAGMVCVGFRSPHSKGQDIAEAELVINDFSEVNYQILKGLVDGCVF